MKTGKLPFTHQHLGLRSVEDPSSVPKEGRVGRLNSPGAAGSSVLLHASLSASQGQHSAALTTLSSFLDEIFIEQLLSVRGGL